MTKHCLVLPRPIVSTLPHSLPLATPMSSLSAATFPHLALLHSQRQDCGYHDAQFCGGEPAECSQNGTVPKTSTRGLPGMPRPESKVQSPTNWPALRQLLVRWCFLCAAGKQEIKVSEMTTSDRRTCGQAG